MDDFILVDKGCARQGLAFEPAIGAVADRTESLLFSCRYFISEFAGFTQHLSGNPCSD